MKKPIVSMVVAVAANGVIGRDNDLPWRLSGDLKRFKAMTMGKPLILGRKNFESLGGRVLPGRPHVVITRNPDFAFDHEQVHIVHSLEAGLDVARDLAAAAGVDEVCIIGGGEIYRLGMHLADILHVTHVDADVPGDTFFPEIDPAVWVAEEVGSADADEKNEYPVRFVTYRRR